MTHQVFFVLACLFIINNLYAAPSSPPSTNKSSGLNKWTDEKGQVHYGDEIPPQYLNQKREVLNEQGIIVKSFNAPKSKDELEKEKQEKEAADKIKREKAVSEKKKELHDRMLLETYTSERDILLSRDDRIQAIDSQIALTESNIKESEKKQTEVNGRIEKTKKSGRDVPENFYKEAESVDKQLKSYHEYIDAKKSEREDIINKYDADIHRFHELKAKQ